MRMLALKTKIQMPALAAAIYQSLPLSTNLCLPYKIWDCTVAVQGAPLTKSPAAPGRNRFDEFQSVSISPRRYPMDSTGIIHRRPVHESSAGENQVSHEGRKAPTTPRVDDSAM